MLHYALMLRATSISEMIRLSPWTWPLSETAHFIGMALLTRMTPGTQYIGGILPSLIIISLGMGLIFVPLSAVSLFAIGDHDAGVAVAPAPLGVLGADRDVVIDRARRAQHGDGGGLRPCQPPAGSVPCR